jgi:hypothetical protein
MIAKMFETDASMAGRFAKPEDAVRYIRAGMATITLRSARTQTRFTYEIEREAEKGEVHWVRVLTGGDNQGDYQYMGMLTKAGEFRRTAKSRIAEDAVSYIAFEWSWKMLAQRKAMPDQLEVWHEGCCGRCGRKLTVPESIADGLGPECRKKARAA